MAGWEAVCRVGEIPEGEGRTFRIRGLEVAVFNDGGRFSAILDRCPHAGGSLGSGWVEDGTAVCPLHYWRFRLDDGRCVAGGGGGVPGFDCEVRDGRVWLST
ncbi:Rieske (2Fe-2S) protein [Tautonia plasticadhaerens]|uniref:Assimilatory nitrite reductase [NAD(P)H] small subunit n=1 Tax=Tautonia plasticadhaerens TaxID=2527974 RepID=A0A518GZ41_9BACT|nr:Rieske (2Fe-2S) protein [Tautonia plasticadhaerens]QDV33859.1 Assimilatory nitrite reductase [NAD(P)H] small subunit [Tautonia plasticadhaerens]